MNLLKIVPLIILTGCSSSVGLEARPDTFDEGQVNRPQNVRIVNIRHISPAFMVEDSRNAPAPTRHSSSNGLLLDTVALPFNIVSLVVSGNKLTGSNSHDGQIIKGVGLDYTDRTDPMEPIMRSTQVGKTCEYKLGPAEMVKTPLGETRIQPNAIC